MKTRIMLADDHALMRMALNQLLCTEKEFSVVGECATGSEAVLCAAKLQPDIIIMDLMMPEMSGAQATREILEAAHKCTDAAPVPKILILTSFGTSQELIEAVRNGAKGVVMKDTAPDDLLAAIRAVQAGEEVIPDMVSRMLAEEIDSGTLTKRQIEVLDMITKGFSDRDIARHFGISLSGAKHHLQKILAKIGATNRAEAAAIAIHRNLCRM